MYHSVPKFEPDRAWALLSLDTNSPGLIYLHCWKDLIKRICWAKFSYWVCGRVVGWFNAENPALLTFKVLTYINFNEDMGVIKNRSVSQFSSQGKCYFLLSSVAT